MEVKRYLEIQRKCNYDANKFLRDSKISPEKFSFDKFYEQVSYEKEIKTMYHSFSTKKIVGALRKDELGKTIMINDSNNRFIQRVGKSHEFTHDGTHLTSAPSQNFTDGIENIYNGSQIKIEQEANTGSMLYLIPDITLYSILIEPRITYSDMLIMFDLEDWLLERRLVRFLQINCQLNYDDSYFIISKFKSKNRFEKWSTLQDIISMEIYSKTIIDSYNNLNFFKQKENTRSDFDSLPLSITL